MVKIEAITLEEAYKDAAEKFECSVTELTIEVVQVPSSGFLGFFKKSAIIVAVKKESKASQQEEAVAEVSPKQEEETPKEVQNILNDTIMPASFVSDQDDEDDDLGSGLEYTADYDDAYDEREELYDDEEESEEEGDSLVEIENIALEVASKINNLFDLTCFNIDKIEVSAYDTQTLLIEFKGSDAALLIGKEGYRYKALSYMIFNWINSQYELQLRLEIAEFLQNQEETINRYLTTVCETIDRDGRAQTKILDGVLVQIALRELRERYPDKYVAIRSTRDGLKFIIVNEYNNY